jgi:hypothetical protein
LNTSNDYSMAFSHHLSSGDQQFYHNLYSNVPQPPVNKDKSDFPYKNQKFDYINNNSTPTIASEAFANSKDSENSKRFSVNNLLKSPADASIEKLSGERMSM